MNNTLNIDLLLDHREKPMTYGIDFTVYQPKRDMKFAYAMKHLQWNCTHCGYKWKGIKKFWKEGKTPNYCPKCKLKNTIISVRK